MSRENEALGPYADILDLPHPEPRRHPRMEPEKRAAQFAPFAALTGYDALVDETARVTDAVIELHEEAREQLNRTLETLLREPGGARGQSLLAEYYVPDPNPMKQGGSYVTYRGIFRRYREYSRELVFEDETVIQLDTLIRLEITETR